MSNGFWGEIKKPIFTLAPMANVTDAAFRRIIAKYGKPDVMWTEFVSADGLLSLGSGALLKDLIFDEIERPIVAQLFTAHPNKMREAAVLVRKMGFDGIDINMGCPDKTIEKQGAGAALIKTPKLAREIIKAAKEGAGNLPVSVKTRTGYNKSEIKTWIPMLLEEGIAALTIHARTRKEMSSVPAHWDEVAEAVRIRDEMKTGTLIIGNGDVKDLTGAREKINISDADGVMLGRAVFGNPWLWGEKGNISIEERFAVMVEHTELFEELLGKTKSFALMKKHYKAYVSGFEGAKELRVKLMAANNASEVALVSSRFLKAKL